MGKKQFTGKEKHDKMTIDEVADDLRVHRSTVSRMLNNGELPYYIVGSRKLVKRVDLDTYFENQRVEEAKGFAQQRGGHGYSHSC